MLHGADPRFFRGLAPHAASSDARKAIVRRSLMSYLPGTVKISLWSGKEPVRDELFSAERLEEHARSLAAAQAVAAVPTRGHSLSRRLVENGTVLLAAYRNTVDAIGEGRAITPASEWLVDNYHLVERHIREIQSDLPTGFYRQLPKLTEGPFTGYPRVFGLAWAFVAHTDSRFDSAMLLR